jgi:hypothetical protein
MIVKPHIMEQNFKEYVGNTNEIMVLLRLIKGIYTLLRGFILETKNKNFCKNLWTININPLLKHLKAMYFDTL